MQTACAGVPPDYFSATGQLWGNPLYDWEALKADNYSWWVERIRGMLRLVDIVRIDHFRGFEAYWKIPYGSPNAIKGEWTKGPDKALFDEIKKRLGNLPIIAEDLGVITPEVESLRDSCGFPGMKILQFAFNENKWNVESASSKDLPHNFKTSNVVVYTGTHDNDTTAGYFTSCSETMRKNAKRYLGLDKNANVQDLVKSFVKLAFSSIADTCIIPLQDIYGIGTEGRINLPSTTGTNWTWRMEGNLLDSNGAKFLSELSELYGRNQNVFLGKNKE